MASSYTYKVYLLLVMFMKSFEMKEFELDIPIPIVPNTYSY